MRVYGEYLCTLIGTLYIQADELGITVVKLLSEGEKVRKREDDNGRMMAEEQEESSQTEAEKQKNKQAQCYVQQAKKELQEYFAKTRTIFEVPVHLQGTPFQEAVWRALREIPYGETRSYKQIAERIGNPKAMRAVGMANNRNKILLIVPCHRVIGANGAMVGFACGLSVKEYLLDMEQQ